MLLLLPLQQDRGLARDSNALMSETLAGNPYVRTLTKNSDWKS